MEPPENPVRFTDPIVEITGLVVRGVGQIQQRTVSVKLNDESAPAAQLPEVKRVRDGRQIDHAAWYETALDARRTAVINADDGVARLAGEPEPNHWIGGVRHRLFSLITRRHGCDRVGTSPRCGPPVDTGAGTQERRDDHRHPPVSPSDTDRRENDAHSQRGAKGISRDVRCACPRWPRYTRKGRAAHETRVCSSIVSLQRLPAQLGYPRGRRCAAPGALRPA